MTLINLYFQAFPTSKDSPLDKNKNGRYILAEALVEDDKFVFVNIYAPNDQTQQVQFLKGLSNSVLNKYAGERMVLGGDLNCVMNEIAEGFLSNKRRQLFKK